MSTDEITISLDQIDGDRVTLCIEICQNGCHTDGKVTITPKQWATVELIRTVTEEAYMQEHRTAKADKEARTEHVVQALDRANEARGVATGIIGAYKRAMRTPEEQAEQVAKDTSDLFGPTRE